MPQNKLKKKVEALTNVVRQLIKEIQANASMAQGTLTALQLHLGEDEWNKIVEELKNIEERRTKENKKSKRYMTKAKKGRRKRG